MRRQLDTRGNLLLGLDVGTGSCKLQIINTAGKRVKSVSTTYPTYYPRTRWVEQDPKSWWKATVQLLRHCKSSLRDVECLALSSQMETIVPVSKNGKALGRAILWSDQRSLGECEVIKERVGERVAHKITGCRIDPMHSGPKILWIKNNQEKKFLKTFKFLTPKDFLNYQITGEFAADYSIASSSLLFDITSRTWSKVLLNGLGIPLEKLPDVYPSSSIIGEVTTEAAKLTGLKAGTPVVAGGGDTPCTALGCGVFEPKQGLLYLGSSASLYSMIAEPVTDPKMRLVTRCHVVDEVWNVGGGMTTAGSCVTWLRDLISSEGKGERTLNRLFKEASGVEAGSNGLLFIPNMMGERNPHYRLNSTGAFVGLTLSHNRSHIAHAILEGVGMQLYSILDAMEDANVQPASVYATGGGMSYPHWIQILSDIFGVKLTIPAVASPEAYGAAMLAGVGIGAITDLRKFTDQMITMKTVLPRERGSVIYNEISQRYNDYLEGLQFVNNAS